MKKEAFEQNPITKGLLKIYYSLKKDGKIPSDKELCTELDYAPSSFASMKAGKRDAPDEFIDAFVKRFKLTREVLLINGKELANDSQNNQQQQVVKTDDMTLRYIASLEKECDFLRNQFIDLRNIYHELKDSYNKLSANGEFQTTKSHHHK